MTLDPLSPDHLALRDQLMAEAEQQGAAVVQVTGDDNGAPYAFTVGAWQRYEVPEAVTVGLPVGADEELLRNYIARAAAGEEFAVGQVYDDLLAGVLVTVERVAKGHYFEFFGSAFLVYRTGDFPAIQLITATPFDDWPWEPDAPEGFDLWQPVLTESGRPESWQPGVSGP